MNKKKAMALVLAATTALSPVTAFAAVELLKEQMLRKSLLTQHRTGRNITSLIAQIKTETELLNVKS